MSQSTNQFQGLPQPEAQLVNPDTGELHWVWYRFLANLWKQTGGSVVPVASGLTLRQVASGIIALSLQTGQTIATVLTSITKGPAAQGQTPGTSPWLFAAPVPGTLIVSSAGVAIGRNGVFYSVGLVGGALPLLAGDTAQVSWTSHTPPTVTWLPSA